jgi:DNA-binding MarR family transcriptional regulator
MRNIISIGGELITTVNNSKKNLTYEVSLFIHLLENDSNKYDQIVPESITEEGIQRVLNCDLGHISRILKKNEKKGYLYRKVLRVENKNRKLCAFFLTQEGIEIAKEIKNELEQT